MKKIKIDKAYLDKALPPMPQAFEEDTRALLRALPTMQEEEIPVKRKSMTALVIAAVLLLVLACGALASQLGLLDFVPTYDKKTGTDVSGMLRDDIPLVGEQMKLATLEAGEVFYDGQVLHMMLKASPNEAGTALASDYGHGKIEGWTLEQAQPYGEKILAFYMSATIPGGMREHWNNISFGGMQDGANLTYLFNHMMPEGDVLENITLEITCRITDWETGEMLEETAFTMDIPKTAEPQAITFDIDRDLESVHMNQVVVSYTPLELNVMLQCTPLWRNLPTFGLLDESGRVQDFASNMVDFGDENKPETYRMIWAAPGDLPEELPVWVYGTDEVLLLNTTTGDATLHPATVDYTGERPSLDSGLSYMGNEIMIVTYDKEVTK